MCAQIQNREWDAGKPTRDWKSKKAEDGEDGWGAARPSVGVRGATRGGSAGRGRGRGKAPPSPVIDKVEDEEDVLMRSMDERAAQLEG